MDIISSNCELALRLANYVKVSDKIAILSKVSLELISGTILNQSFLMSEWPDVNEGMW